MALASGTRLGPFQITGLIGVGGMGEVYRATDTRLGRAVAIKVLPEALAQDAERLARFDREARTLATLNHPHIAAIHGVEEGPAAFDSGQAGEAGHYTRALVMELVEGPTLADRIAGGPLSVDEALPIARQIADALEAAHERGIVHRDLKPANIKVRPDGTVKVLDFGLARAVGPPEGGPYGDVGAGFSRPSASLSPTITSPAMTQAGMILGTAAYMSPEQARGKPVDRRTDIWAFGCVLFEMLTGTRAFDAEDVSLTLSKILQREADFGALPAGVPPHVAQALRVCLRKDPRERASDIHDVRLALEGAFESPAPMAPGGGPAPPRPLWKRALPAVVAAVIVGALAAAAAWLWKPAPPRPVARSLHPLPQSRTFRGAGMRLVAIAPDSRYFVYNATGGFYLRSIDSLGDRLIPSDGGGIAGDPVISPDGQSVAFFRLTSAGGEIARLPIAGGTSDSLAKVRAPLGLTWGDDGNLLWAELDGIWQVPQSGGEPTRLFATQPGEVAFKPQRLPGSDWILFTVTKAVGAARWDMADIVAQSIGSGERRVLRQRGSDARYLSSGHLVYALENVLYAAAFDADRVALIGEPAPVVQGVNRVIAPGGNSGAAFYDVSADGTLVYVPGSDARRAAGLMWVKPDGTRAAIPLPPGDYSHPRVSPDGRWLAVERQQTDTADIWIYDTAATTQPRRLTDGGNNRFPVWSRDGAFIVFQSSREGDLGIFRQRADGAGAAERLTKPSGMAAHVPEDWSPASDILVFSSQQGGESDLWTWNQSRRTIEKLGGQRTGSAANAVFSPDGEWLAYTQRVSVARGGSVRTYVQSVRSPEVRYQVGRDEEVAHHPLWSRDGRRLYYFPSGFPVVSVDIRFTPSFGFGEPVPLPGQGLPVNVSPVSSLNHDIAPDGRFVVVGSADAPSEDGASSDSIVIVQNWFEELKRLVPR